MTVDFFKQKYGYEIEGFWFPRVTAVTSLFSKASFFASGARLPLWQASADWGTLVHSTIANFLLKKPQDIDQRIVPSVEIFKKWQKTHGFEIQNPKEHIEKRIFDKENCYAGTADLIARVGGKLGLIDIKTGTEIREEHSLQTAAYFAAYNLGKGKLETCETRWILRIDQYKECMGCFAKMREKSQKESVSQGNPLCNHQWSVVKGEIEFRELVNHEQDLQAFLSAKEVWEWYNKDWLSKIINYPKTVSQQILF